MTTGLANQDGLSYYDVMDTVRTSIRLEPINGLEEPLRIGAGHLILSLLCGKRPVISQTQAFDSTLVLGAASPQHPASASFRGLVKNGFIRIHLFNQPSVVDAFAASLRKPNFLYSAWPEITNGTVDRNAVLESLHGESPDSLPDAVRLRVESVKELNSAHEPARKLGEAKPSTPLSELLKNAADPSDKGDPNFHFILQELAELKATIGAYSIAILSVRRLKSATPAKIRTFMPPTTNLGKWQRSLLISTIIREWRSRWERQG